MTTLIEQYETSKDKALKLMNKGQLGAYISALVEMNSYKKLVLAASAS